MKNRYIFYGLFVMLLAAVLTSCINEDNGDTWSLGVGDKCPDFNITMNDGREISTEQLRGRKSMIVFFNTTCSDCQCEFPVLQDLYDIVRKRPDESKVEIICISCGQGDDVVSQCWKEYGLSLPYSAQTDKSVYYKFASSIVPRIYVISPDLTVTASSGIFSIQSGSSFLPPNDAILALTHCIKASLSFHYSTHYQKSQ